MKVETQTYQFDTVEVRPASCEVLRDGGAVSLEPKAFRVLLYLIENRDRAVSKDELIGAVWEGAAVTDNALTRIVAQLRRELGDDARQSRYIQTLPTLGYRFVAELKVQADRAPAAVETPARQTPWMGLGAAGLTLAAVAAWLSWHAAPSGPQVANLHPVQLTTSPGIDAGGSFSPDGNSIVFSSDRDGWFEIYARPVVRGSGHERQITSNGKQNIEPAWSPDGKWIALHSAAAHGIWVAPAAGGEPRQVSAFGSAPAWSPDSKQIAFRSVEPFSFALFDLAGVGESTIWTVGRDGSGLRRLTNPQNPPGQHASPSWSPDGRRVLFNSFAARSALWTIDVASGELQPVETSGATPLLPVFAPDGGIYFAGPARAGGFTIFYNREGSREPVELHEGSAGLPLQIAVSRDGRKLLYTRCTSVSQLWQSGGDSPSHALYRDTVVRARLPAFSPDGGRLAYLVQRQGAGDELWMMNADGSGAAAVTAAPGPQSGAGWNADGSAILYAYRESGASLLHRIAPAGGGPRLLRRITQPIGQPHVTPDEREVVYSAGAPANLWKAPLDGSTPPRQLTFEREAASFPSVSWDGKWIAYESQKANTTQIKVIGREGGRQEQLTDDDALNWSNSWAADNRRVAFAAFRDGVWNIWWVDRVTKQRKQITHHTAFGSFVRNPAWRPGTEEIVYEHWLVTGNIYLAELPGAAR